VSLLSLYPTLTDLCGLPAKPDNDAPSLAPLLENPQAAWSHVAITQLHQPGNFSVSADDWRYIHYRDEGEELYQNSSDRYEWTNLAKSPEHAARLAEMRKLAPVLTPRAKAAYAAASAKEDSKKKAAPLAWRKPTGDKLPVSKPEGGLFNLRFYNKRNHAVKLFWISPNNKREFFSEILPEASVAQSTRAGAVWLVTDSQNKELGYFVANKTSTRALILEE
jgi:hypothetical protein